MHQLEPMYDGRANVQVPDDSKNGFQYGIHDNKPFAYSFDTAPRTDILGNSVSPRYWQRWYSDLLQGTLTYPTQASRGNFGFGPQAWAHGNFTTQNLGRGKGNTRGVPTPIPFDFKKFAPRPGAR
jgi:hypothetical protein